MEFVVWLILFPLVAFCIAAFLVHRKRPKASKIIVKLSLIIVPLTVLTGSAIIEPAFPAAGGILIFLVWVPLGGLIALALGLVLEKRRDTSACDRVETGSCDQGTSSDKSLVAVRRLPIILNRLFEVVSGVWWVMLPFYLIMAWAFVKDYQTLGASPFVAGRFTLTCWLALTPVMFLALAYDLYRLRLARKDVLDWILHGGRAALSVWSFVMVPLTLIR